MCCIQVKAIEQYFPVVLFIMLYTVALMFESVNEILRVKIQMRLSSLLNLAKYNVDSDSGRTNWGLGT